MKKNKFILVAGVIVLAAVIAIFVTNRERDQATLAIDKVAVNISEYKNGKDIFILPSELYENLGDSNVVILDGNHPNNYGKGHLPGAISLGFKGLCKSDGKPGDPLWGTIFDKKELTQKLESLGVTNESLIVAYSDTFKGPGAGGRAVWQLKMAGFENVRLLSGGLEGWKQAGYELTKEVPELKPSSGLALKDYDESHRALLGYVKENIGKTVILDVRSKKEFTGDDTSRGESRGGHIQGAKWLEWTALLNDDATAKKPEEIISLLAEYGVKPEDDFVVY